MAIKHMQYRLAAETNYKFNIVRMGFNNYDQLAYYYKEDFPDVEITRPGTDTDLSLLHTDYLLTVNGYVYNTVYSDNRLYIPEATKSMLKSRANVIGLLSLPTTGSNVTKMEITPDMVSTEPNIQAYNKVFITFPNTVHKPILVMAGYLVFENPEYFYRVADNIFALRLDKLNYIERLYELFRYRNIFKDLNVPVSPNNDSMIDGTLIRSELTIKRFLSLNNSFLVDLNVDNLTVNRIYLEHSNVPCNFRTEIDPTLPVMVGYGKLTEYSKEKQNDVKWTVTTQDGHYDNFVLSAQSQYDINVFNNHRVPGSTYRLSSAFFLDLSVET